MVTMLQKQHIHFRLGDQIAILCTFLSRKQFTHFIRREKWFTHFFVAKAIYALRPEIFCALNFAIRKVQTFWASAGELEKNQLTRWGMRKETAKC